MPMVGWSPRWPHSTRRCTGVFALPMPDWDDRDAAAEFAAARGEIRGDDPVAARVIAAVHMANQLGAVFAKLDCTPRWRDRRPRSLK
jgi:hypothetical protein